VSPARRQWRLLASDAAALDQLNAFYVDDVAGDPLAHPVIERRRRVPAV